MVRLISESIDKIMLRGGWPSAIMALIQLVVPWPVTLFCFFVNWLADGFDRAVIEFRLGIEERVINPIKNLRR